MSVQDAERFANDLKAKPQLLADLKKTAAGKGLSGVCQFAKQKGYNVTVEEAKKYIRGKAKGELNDQQLDRIAGGKGPAGGSGDLTAAIAVVAGPMVAQVAVGPVQVAMQGQGGAQVLVVIC